MALITCPECGAEVSSHAKACPKCAYPMAPEAAKVEPSESPAAVIKRAGAPWEMAGTGLCILAIFVGFASPGAGGALFLIGLTVFVIGRFN